MLSYICQFWESDTNELQFPHLLSFILNYFSTSESFLQHFQKAVSKKLTSAQQFLFFLAINPVEMAVYDCILYFAMQILVIFAV